MWYRLVMQYIPGRLVPPLHGIYLITHVVSADHTIYTWSAGTTFAWYIFNHTCGIGRSHHIYLVGRTHMYMYSAAHRVDPVLGPFVHVGGTRSAMIFD